MKTKTNLFALIALLLGSIVWVGLPVADADYANLKTIVPMEQGYIRGDGSIDPPSLPIQRQGNFYWLTDNIENYTIEIQKNNIILDGNSYTLSLPQSVATWSNELYGAALIQIQNSENITIENTQFTNYFRGININNSSRITILANNFTNGGSGVGIRSSAYCDVLGNNVKESAVSALDSTYLTIFYNNISRRENSALYLDGITFSNISRNDIGNLEGYASGGGIFILRSSNNRIFENNLFNKPTGILYSGDRNSSVNNLVYENYFHNNGEDIFGNGGDATSSTNESPLSSPISTEFEPQLHPIPTQYTTDSNPSDEANGPDSIVIVAALASTFLVLVSGFLWYRQRHN